MGKLAARAITPEGSELREAAISAAEDLSDDVFELAPLEFGDLKASGHPSVTDDGAVVYDRAPNVGRLSEEELRIKGHLRGMFRFERRRP